MLSLILGTRPEIIKFSPIIRTCESRKIPFFTLHTGQHYSYEMDRIFFEELGLPQPEFNIDARSGFHGEQTGKILAGVETVLLDEKPDGVLVQGDTNTVLAGALAAAKLHIPVGHVEAGLRSFDRSMPEEINRVVADHISEYLFAPTEMARGYLLAEGIQDEKITITGNTVVDAVFQNLEIAKRKGIPAELKNLKEKQFLLVTAHRAENVDSRDRLRGILEGLAVLHRELDMPVVYSVHPRTEKMMKQFGLKAPGLTLIQPLGYLEFLNLESMASLVLTDSGGLQEESCILGVPCVTLRENTERPETIEVGSNALAGTDPSCIVEKAWEMIDRTADWQNPYGDGHSGEYIVNILEEAGLAG